jgi:hypothetical protein
LSAIASIGITFIVSGSFGETQARLLATTAALAAFSLMALPSLLHLERGRIMHLARFAVVATVAAFMLTISTLWEMFSSEPSEGKIWATLVIVAFASNHISLLFLATPRNRLMRACLNATTVVLTALAALLVMAMWAGVDSEPVLRTAGVLAILDVLGTIAVPILARIYRMSPSQASSLQADGPVSP